MERIQYKNHAKQKEAFTENERFRFSRFQDPRDNCWYAYAESKTDSFYCFNGPWKRKYKATDQLATWTGIDNLNI